MTKEFLEVPSSLASEGGGFYSSFLSSFLIFLKIDLSIIKLASTPPLIPDTVALLVYCQRS
jgi:hypothetical protein